MPLDARQRRNVSLGNTVHGVFHPPLSAAAWGIVTGGRENFRLAAALNSDAPPETRVDRHLCNGSDVAPDPRGERCGPTTRKVSRTS